MLAELVLVTRLLGLVSGDYPIAIYVDPRVASVELLRNGETIKTVKGPPWQTIVNFGEELVPQELTALAFDAAGNVIGKDTQLVNLPRPTAEAAIDIRREGDSVSATVHWQHIGVAKVRDVKWKLDGKDFGNGETSLLLPLRESKALHVLEAEITFWDGAVARKERVFGGMFTEEVPTELTGVVVHEEKGTTVPATCFRLGGKTIPAAAVERGGEAMVVFVRSPDPKPARKAIRANSRDMSKARYGLASDVRIFWPSATRVVEKERSYSAKLFEHSQVMDGDMGTHAIITGRGVKKNDHLYADAVAVGGSYAALGARRRAVVLVIANEKDASVQKPAVVRRYLARLGVPFFVWSLVGAKKEVTDVWGEVVDIGNAQKLYAATEALRKELVRQKVAWLPLQPLDALKVRAAEGCAFTPVAKP